MSTTPALKPAELAELPALLRNMVRAVGLQPTLALVEWRGGTPIFIPEKISPEHELWIQVGRKGAEWLCQEYPCESVQIPKAEDYLRMKRDADIRTKNAEGISAAKLAMEYGLHIRQIWRILSDGEDSGDTRQQKLL